MAILHHSLMRALGVGAEATGTRARTVAVDDAGPGARSHRVRLTDRIVSSVRIQIEIIIHRRWIRREESTDSWVVEARLHVGEAALRVLDVPRVTNLFVGAVLLLTGFSECLVPK